MLAWRLCREPYAKLDGDGARLFGGRWNSPGRPMVYLATSPALTVLEVRVHLDLPLDLLPDDYVLMTIDLDALPIEVVADEHPDPRALGDVWLAEARTPLLSVPSAIVPESRNLLLNPRHADAPRARVVAQRAFTFDPRLWVAG